MLRVSAWTLRRKLVVLTTALLLATVGTISAVSTIALSSSMTNQLDLQLRQANQRGVGPLVGGNPRDTTEESSPPDSEETPPGLRGGGQSAGTISLFTDGQNVLAGYYDTDGVYQSLNAEQAQLLIDAAAAEPVSITLPDLGEYRMIATEVEGFPGESSDTFTTVTALPLEDVHRTVGQFILIEVLMTLIGIACAAVVGALLVRRSLKPLESVAATASTISQLPLERGHVSLPERVEQEYTDPATEVGKVGEAFNQMLGHIEQALTSREASEQQLRQFVADASHELRTPLASIRGYSELVRRSPEELPPDAKNALGRVESEAIRMTRLVDDMLLLARLDSGRTITMAPTNVVEQVLEAVADAHVAGRDHQWRLDIPETDQPVLVLGEPDQMRQIWGNLLTNARIHTPPGTLVTARVRVKGQQVVIEFENNGPEIPEGLRDHLFDRFTKGDSARSPGVGSSGLGLSIVKAIVTAHEGTIAVDPGDGKVIFRVMLPLYSPE